VGRGRTGHPLDLPLLVPFLQGSVQFPTAPTGTIHRCCAARAVAFRLRQLTGHLPGHLSVPTLLALAALASEPLQ